jgi:uncharacterized protein
MKSARTDTDGVMALVWLLGGLALYAAVLGGLYVAQDSLLFPHVAAQRGYLPLPEDAERQELLSAEGHRLVGYGLRRAGAKVVVLVFPGNAWNAEDCLIFTAQRLDNVHLLAFHYRGYAPSEGTPSEEAFIADAVAQRELALRLFQPRSPGERLQVFAIGYSIGSAVAARLAGDGLVDGAILVTPFDSIEAIAKARYFFAPVSLLLKHKFRSDRALAGKDVPVAVIAASEDQIVPKVRSDALVASLAHPVMTVTVQGVGHGSLYDLPAFGDLLTEALSRLTSAAETG